VRVDFSRRALTRLRGIHAYIAERDPAAAERVIAEIANACRLLGEQPSMGRAVEGTRLRFHLTRRFRYRIIYRVDETRIFVRDVLHPRQAWR
jgi:plasmid stabilization system protein ParE